MLQEFLTGGKPYSFIISSAAIPKRTRTQVIAPSFDTKSGFKIGL